MSEIIQHCQKFDKKSYTPYNQGAPEKERKGTEKKESKPLYSILSLSKESSLSLDRIDNYPIKMQNETTTDDCRATSETMIEKKEEENEIRQDPFCTGRCSVCDSGFIEQINSLRSKLSYRALSEEIKNEYGIEISKDALNLHFQKYNDKLRRESVKKAYELFDTESATLAVHTKQTLFLASYTFEEIMRRMQNGSLIVGIDEFEKLMKLYYQIIKDPTGSIAPDALAIYTKAYQFYKIPISQKSFDFNSSVGSESPKESEIV